VSNKHQKITVINSKLNANATSSPKCPSRWKMATMSIQWCLMVCQISTNAHLTFFKWCISTISRWWSTIRWIRWMKAWRAWASHHLSSLHLKERAQAAVIKKFKMHSNINQDAKKLPSKSQETSSQWCSQVSSKWASKDLAKKLMDPPTTWVDRSLIQASHLPFKGKDVVTL